MQDKRTDEKLVEAAQKGDSAAFEVLVRRYQSRVVSIAFSVLRNSEDAADVAQEVFLRVYRKLGGFCGKSRFYTWLFRITVNMSIDRSRSRQRKRAESLDQEDQETGENRFARIPDSDLDPREAGADSELERKIHEAIDELSPKHRQVVLLRDVQGLSYQEIAQVVRCSLGTVMSRLHYAREKLKEKVRPLLPSEAEEGGEEP